ncbi:MAG: pyridoxal-dependent decarboxylase [Planctomycetota bacterium]|nr:pyridoxal-dependent decarboxylase [Planctomycetota bacterium]
MDFAFQATVRLAKELCDAEDSSDRFSTTAESKLCETLDLQLRPQGRSEEEVFQSMRKIMHATPKTSSRRFYNQLFAGRLPIATSADWLTSMMNVSMYTLKVAGPMIQVEQEVAKRMCKFAGFPNGDGLSMPGGSVANLIAMMMGRNHAMPEIRNKGCNGKRLTYYISVEGHYSVRKNAGVLGTGRDNVRKIAVDEKGKMRPDALRAAIVKDLSEGAVPCAIIATAGTTVMGEFDPIRPLAMIAKEFDIWLHVDGAFGGTLLLHSEGRKKLDGIELADSLTWDAHKAMGIPLTCSMLLTKDAQVMDKNLNEAADYLFQSDDNRLNPGTRHLQCGRPNDTFKLWAAWQQMGDEGWEKRIGRQLELAQKAAERIRQEDDLELAIEPASTTVCFRVKGIDSPTVCEKLHDQGLAWIGYGDVFGEDVIRIVTSNPEVQDKDLDRLFDDIRAVVETLKAELLAVSRSC